MQLSVEKEEIGNIPCYMVYPLKETGKSAVFYHGWSSRGELQLTRAALLALEGYTVCVPDAVHHGERGPLSDYYTMESYDLFWETIFQNTDEFSFVHKFIAKKGYEKPVIFGHSMGGFSVLGIAAAYGDRIAGAVSFNGSGDWELSHLFMQARFGISLGENWKLYEEVKKRSPLHDKERLKGVRLLLLSGEDDMSVDPRAQMNFYHTMKNEGADVKKMTYPGLGHFVTTNMMDEAVNWLKDE